MTATAAQLNLRASLEASKALDAGEPIVSPLTGANPHSLDILFDRINSKLAQRLPETIDDDAELYPMVEVYRNRRESFRTEQAKKSAESKPRRRKTTKAEAAELMEIEDLSELTSFTPDVSEIESL